MRLSYTSACAVQALAHLAAAGPDRWVASHDIARALERAHELGGHQRPEDLAQEFLGDAPAPGNVVGGHRPARPCGGQVGQRVLGVVAGAGEPHDPSHSEVYGAAKDGF
jgi:hypothetical protein